MRIVLEEYGRYANFSNLHLNRKKRYVIPLFPAEELETAKAHIVEMVEGAGGMCFAWYAIYLGIYLGPGAGEVGWEAPILKYLDRARQWGEVVKGCLCLLGIMPFTVCQFYNSTCSSIHSTTTS